MGIIDILNENRLATTSVVLGILSTLIFFLIQGTVNVFLYLGIPAVVIGVICIMKLEKLRDQRRLDRVILPLIGIILGMLPIIFIILAIS
jgi:hypothetical protein